MSKSMKININGKTATGGEWQCPIQGPEPQDNHPGYWRENRLPIGERISMGLGYIYLEDAGTHLRLFRYSSRGNINFYEDLKQPGTYIVGPHSCYCLEAIDPEKAETEDWYPWETKEDYIKKISK